MFDLSLRSGVDHTRGEIGRVTLRTLKVPGTRRPRPVQGIARRDLVAWVKVEPTLTPLAPTAGVPGEACGLQASSGKGNEILLQGIDAKGVRDLEIMDGPVRSLRREPEATLAPKNTRVNVGTRTSVAREVPEHGRLRSGLHGQRVVGCVPAREFFGVAATAGLRTHKCGGLGRRRRDAGSRLLAGTAARHACGERRCHEDPSTHRADITPGPRVSGVRVMVGQRPWTERGARGTR